MAMGKAGFPKKQSKLHDPMYAKKGVKPLHVRLKNKLKNYKQMMANRVARQRREL